MSEPPRSLSEELRGWSDERLAGLFRANFEAYAGHVPEGVRQAGPLSKG